MDSINIVGDESLLYKQIVVEADISGDIDFVQSFHIHLIKNVSIKLYHCDMMIIDMPFKCTDRWDVLPDISFDGHRSHHQLLPTHQLEFLHSLCDNIKKYELPYRLNLKIDFLSSDEILHYPYIHINDVNTIKVSVSA